MKRNFLRWTLLGALAGLSSAVLAQLPRAGNDDYTIHTTIRLAKPYDVRAMNDEFQSAKLISEKDGVGTFEIVYRPFHVQEVNANPNWRVDDAKMTDYLRPRTCANWDEDLRKKILEDLREAGIDPKQLDDRTLVQKISIWALKRSSFNDQFGLWMIEFNNGKPTVPSKFSEAFAEQEPKGMPIDEIYDREVYGKGMYFSKTHGACTSTSTYLATILRAVGIPTRIILTVPAGDPNDPKQVKMLYDAIRHHKTARAIKFGLNSKGFVNHVYNEVWVGKKWVRLNYQRLGQPILDPYYCGLMTHVYTVNDISEVPFTKTWGARFALEEGPKLSSVNPYQLVAAKDELRAGVVLDNPKIETLTSVTVVKILKANDPDLPEWAKLPANADVFFVIKDWLKDQNYMQMREFLSEAASTFVLTAPGQPPVTARLQGLNISDEHGDFQAFAVKLDSKLTPGVDYTVAAVNENHPHVWHFALGLVWRG